MKGYFQQLIRSLFSCLGVFICFLPSGTRAASTALQFNRDIRPILADNCLACHGPDSAKRKASLRLDTREGLYGKTKDEGLVITPGALDKSALWKRIVSTDKDEMMPPPESHKLLTPEQKERLRQWIVAGAAWQSHWSFIKPERGSLPKVKNPRWIRNSIDPFVLEKLEEKGLSPAPEADRRTLARRLALDLTGLPPKPADLEAFISDRSANYYEKFVKQLLDSLSWGEHRTRYWLDAARYADTHGLHFDNYREMWPYRDWVIRAFNSNEAFDQFVIEQIAGDLLPEPSQDQIIATGFHRCNMTTNEGGTIEEENLVNYANDRVTTTGWVFLGLTLNCSACHDHKFDPLSMRDFYSMAAFFRNTTQTGLDGNVKDSNPSITVVTDAMDLKRWKALPAEIEVAKSMMEKSRKDAEPEFAKWVGGLRKEDLEREQSGETPAFHAPLNDGKTDQIHFRAQGVEGAVASTGLLKILEDGKTGPAPRFGKDVTAAFAGVGDYDQEQPFSFGSWVYVPENYNGAAAILSRMDEGNHYRGWDLWIEKGEFASHIVHQWPGSAIKVRTNKRLAKTGQWHHVMATYDGSGKAEGLRIYVNGAAAALETENGAGVKGTLRTSVPFRLAQRSTGAHFDGVGLQDVRVYARALTGPQIAALANSAVLAGFLGKPLEQWKPDAKQQALNYYLSTRYRPFQDSQKLVASLDQEKGAIRMKYPVTHVQIEKQNSEPMAAVLFRGQYDKPRDKVGADVVGALHKFPSEAPRNRLGLAKWLTSPENALTARVTVNRFWQEVFGTGLVKTVEDFGATGENPSNQALLDWLAVEFRESGWDVKKLFTLMVTSAAYRQSAVTTAEKLEKDPGNRFLSRGPRFRMDAEMIRDYALAISGLLVPKIGGPSVKPYQPEGVWEAVAMPESNTKRYQRDSGESLYRRSLYTFWKRAAPPALMDIFNAPSRETCTVRRERTNTPLQALATLNDPQFVEAARKLAETALVQSQGDSKKAVAFMAKSVLARDLRSGESAVLRDTLSRLTTYYDAHPEEAGKLVKIGEATSSTSIRTTQLAALTLVANQILNLDEALTK